MSDKTTPSVSITNAAAELLANALSQQGWTDKRKEVVSAGKLVARLEEITINRPAFEGKVVNGQPTEPAEYLKFTKESTAWERSTSALLLTDAEFQACVSCLKHFSDAKKIPGNRYGAELLELFKLSE